MTDANSYRSKLDQPEANNKSGPSKFMLEMGDKMSGISLCQPMGGGLINLELINSI